MPPWNVSPANKKFREKPVRANVNVSFSTQSSPFAARKHQSQWLCLSLWAQPNDKLLLHHHPVPQGKGFRDLPPPPSLLIQGVRKKKWVLMLDSIGAPVIWIERYRVEQTVRASWNILNPLAWLSVLSNKTGSRSPRAARIYADMISIMPLWCVVCNEDEHV